jgi:hypothetical protein
MSHLRQRAISIKFSNVGCELFVTHFEMVAGSLPNISANSLFDTMRSASITLMRFRGCFLILDSFLLLICAMMVQAVCNRVALIV